MYAGRETRHERGLNVFIICDFTDCPGLDVAVASVLDKVECKPKVWKFPFFRHVCLPVQRVHVGYDMHDASVLHR